jgi:hypothetical protein
VYLFKDDPDTTGSALYFYMDVDNANREVEVCLITTIGDFMFIESSPRVRSALGALDTSVPVRSFTVDVQSVSSPAVTSEDKVNYQLTVYPVLKHQR